MIADPSRRKPGRLGLIVILGSLTAFAPLSIDMYLPAFPALEAHFGASAGAVQGTLAAFFVGLALGQSVHGPLSDRLGRRLPMLGGIIVYVAASIAAIFAPDIESLSLLRFIQALGGCAGIVIARAMVRDLFDERDSARVFSLLMLVMGLAPILAPVLGGQLLAFADWRWIFAVLAAFGAACLAAVAFALPETLSAEQRQRGGLARILHAYGRLLADPVFMGFSLSSGLLMAGMFAYITGSPFVFITLYGVSPQDYGLLFGLNAVGLIATSQINLRLLRHYSGRDILKVVMAVQAVAALVLAGVALVQPAQLAFLLAPLFVCIASLGFVSANASAAAMSRAGANAGIASALIGVLQFALGAVGGACVGLFDDGTAAPMGCTIAGLSVAGLLSHRLLTGRAGQSSSSAA
ncbi:Bcr/CflA family multidrug efflux MFS transporter [Zavarzinia aquatilis]|uniref:Bcr/CflA family efflux transporter n=1 Tax=Zavarzinia aquatilis TaxID=2211142 RepID=A0A317DVZ9_9PROT|nr:Bcr/CflA family multidrug efflux MFS transporter [Zavarzinia aquatilis]PWR18140.1 Bcr/CflA family drug resistance efflux transporter [Zavarzinia aquatilis]